MTGVPEFEAYEGVELKYEQLAAYLEDRIRAGDIPLGARLPGERAMCDQYGVALSTVRKALDILRGKELVATRAAKGTFVARVLPQE